MQSVIVALAVAVATGFLAWRYAPYVLRRAGRSWLAKAARHFGWTALEKRIEAKAQPASSCADGCGSCGGCKPETRASEDQSAITLEELRKTARR